MKSDGSINQVKTPASIERKYAVLKTNSRQAIWLEMGTTGEEGTRQHGLGGEGYGTS